MCVDYASIWSMLTMLLESLGYVASVLFYGCHLGLDYLSAYACFCNASMGHDTLYLIPCNELSQPTGCLGEFARLHPSQTTILCMTVKRRFGTF
jgi:hypothetical protein